MPNAVLLLVAEVKKKEEHHMRMKEQEPFHLSSTPDTALGHLQALHFDTFYLLFVEIQNAFSFYVPTLPRPQHLLHFPLALIR